MPNKLISVVTLNGQDYDIKDAWARQAIEGLGTPTHFAGETTSDISDGSTTNPIQIGGKSYTAQAGDIVVHGNAEFIWSGSAWIELGDLSGLGDLAYKDNASGSYTPAGTVSQPTFSNGAASVSATYTPAGTVTLTKSSETVVSGVSKSTDTVQGMKTAGSVTAGSAPSFTEGTFSAGSLPSFKEGAFSAGTLPSIDTTKFNGGSAATFTEGAFDAGSLPSFTAGAFSAGTLPTWSASVDDSTETLSFSWSQGTLPSKAADTFDAGSLPSKASDTFNGGSAASISAGFFNAGSLPSKAADTWDAGSLPSKGADTFNAGSVTQVTLPTFEEATFVTDVTATEGDMDFVSSASFSGTEATIQSTGTATGTVSQPTFSGTEATVTVS